MLVWSARALWAVAVLQGLHRDVLPTERHEPGALLRVQISSSRNDVLGVPPTSVPPGNPDELVQLDGHERTLP